MDASTVLWLVAPGLATGLGGLGLLCCAGSARDGSTRSVRERIRDRLPRREERWAALMVGDLVPESHGRGSEREATAGIVVGVAAMMLLDSALG